MKSTSSKTKFEYATGITCTPYTCTYQVNIVFLVTALASILCYVIHVLEIHVAYCMCSRGSLTTSHLLLYPSLWLLLSGLSSQFLPLLSIQPAFIVNSDWQYL